MSKTRHEFEIDYGPIVQGFDAIRSGVNATDQNITGLSKDTKSAFDAMTTSARNYNRELSGTARDIINVQNETKKEVDVIRQLTAARKATNDHTKVDQYNKQIDASRNKIKALNAEQKKGADENKKDVKESIGLINSLIDKQKKLADARDRSNDPALIKRYNKLIDETKNKLNDLSSIEKKSETGGSGGFGGAFSVFTGNLLFAGIQKVKDAFKDFINGQVQFEKSIKNLSAITGASGNDLVFYGDSAIEMGRKIEGGAVAAVEAYKLIGSAKPELLKNKEALVEVTDAAITLSQASGLTLPEAASNLGQALNAFDESADNSTKFINVFAAAAQLGAQEIPFLTEALGKFGGVAKGAGVSIEESASAIEILGQKIPEATTVGTNLRNILIILQTEANKQGRAFKGLKGELDLLAPKLEDIGFLEKTFGRENLLATQILINQKDELAKLTAGVTGTSSAFEQAATNTDTWAQSLTEAGNAYNELLLSISNSGIGGVFKEFTDGATEALKDLSALFRGDLGNNENIQAIKDLGNISEVNAKKLSALGLEIKNIYKISPEEKETINTLIRSQAILSTVKDASGSRAVMRALISDIDKLNAAYEVGDVEVKDYNVQIKILRDALNKAAEANKNFNKTVSSTELQTQIGIIEKLQKEITALTEARTKAVSVTEISRLNIQIKSKQDELDRLTGKENDKLKQAKDEFKRAIDQLRKDSEKASVDQLNGQARIEKDLEFNEKELQITKDHFIKLGLAVDKKYKMSAEQEEQFQLLLNAIRKKAADDSIKLEVERQAEIDNQRKQFNSNSIESLSLEESSKINTVQGIKKPTSLNNFEEVDFEESKQKQILDIQEQYGLRKFKLKQNALLLEEEAEKQALQKQLALLGNANDLDTNVKRQKIQSDLDLLGERYDLEGKKIKNEVDQLVNDIQSKRDELNKAKPFNLAKFFGVSEDQLNSTLNAINQIGGYTQDAIDSYFDLQNKMVDAEIQKNEKLVSEREKNIADLESQLQNAKQLQDEGQANDFDRIKSKIANEEAARQEDLKNERKAKQEKSELAKKQLIADTIVQASNLVVAATQIYATVAKDPYSTAIATATVAAMLAAFTVQKVNAFKSVNQDIGSNKFASGVIDLKGPGSETSDSIPSMLSKGESVMTAKETRDNKKLFLGLRQDDDVMMKEGILSLIKNKGIILEDDLPESISIKKQVVKQQEINAYLQTDNSRLEKEMKEMKEILSLLLLESKKGSYSFDGKLVLTNGSHKTIIKK